MNRFILLGLAPAFDLDMAALEIAYFRLQRQFHPDRFAGKPALERQRAMQRSADINQAYRTLKHPLPRAQYILHLQGMEVGGGRDSIKPSPALLMETMEWRERIEEAQALEKLEKLHCFLNQSYVQSIAMIAKTCKERLWDSMAQEALRLGYIIKAQEALAGRKKQLDAAG